MVCHAPGGSTDMNRCRSKLYPRRSSTSSILVFRLRDRPVMSRELAGEVSAPVDCTSPRGGAGAEEEQQRQRELLLALFGRSSSPPLFVELAPRTRRRAGARAEPGRPRRPAPSRWTEIGAGGRKSAPARWTESGAGGRKSTILIKRPLLLCLQAASYSLPKFRKPDRKGRSRSSASV